MALNNIDEYIEDMRGLYLKASKKEKGKILDEFTRAIGCHRKAAIRLLRHSYQHKVKGQRGRPIWE